MRGNQASTRIESLQKRRLLIPAILVFLLFAVWVFPSIWFEEPQFEGTWFGGETNIPGWKYVPVPVSETAEKILTSDDVFCGEFSSEDGRRVTVFLANRAGQAENDLQLFAHPPDVCWRNAGFEMLPVSPTITKIEVHGLKIPFERRIFEKDGHRELVYYAGLISGRPPPFRMAFDDRVREEAGENTETPSLRSLKRIPQTFWSRKTLAGPKQFIRISTEVKREAGDGADGIIREFAPVWLKPREFERGKRAKRG